MKNQDYFDFELNFDIDSKPREKAPQPSYQDMRGAGLDNMFLMNAPGNNAWGIPDTYPFTGDLSGIEWIDFGNINKQTDCENYGLSYYVEDYKFKCIWNNPQKYVELLKRFRAVITPDFSNYADMANAQQLWNTYRRQWCGKFWQDNGIKIINSLSWATGNIQDWTFSGIPEGTTCATSFVGNRIDKETAMKDLEFVINLKKPCKLYIKASERDVKILRKNFDFDVIRPYEGWI